MRKIKCPYCNKDMKLGIIHGDRYALKWISKAKDKGSILHPFVNGIKLSSKIDSNKAEAYLCGNCKKVIIDLPK